MRVLLLIFYNVWLAGIGLLIINTVSRYVFSKAIHWTYAVWTIMFAFVWPIAVFSPEGRKNLFIRAQQL